MIKVKHNRDGWSVDNTCRIEIDRDQHDFQLRKRWFMSRNLGTFSKYLPKKFDGSSPIRICQIGVWEGADLVWQFQNTAKHPDSSAVAIDPWLPMMPKHDAANMDKVYQRAVHNLGFFNCQIIKAKSQDVLTDLQPDHYDLVVIDGEHSEDPCYSDAVQSFRICKPGGWMLFDDVRNSRNFQAHVWHAVTRFCEDYDGKIKLAWDEGHCSCIEKL
jgi:hypothetical protein